MLRLVRMLAGGLVGGTLGCASWFHPGLSHAPGLGSDVPPEPPPGDVVANGPSACGRGATEGPLRGVIPPCPTVSPRRSPLPEPAPPRAREADAEVSLWVRHFYVGWPCPPRSERASRALLFASAPTDLRGSRCATP